MLELYCVSKHAIVEPAIRNSLARWSLRECGSHFDHAQAIRCDLFAIDADSSDCEASLQRLRNLRPETVRVVIADRWQPSLLRLAQLAHRVVRSEDPVWPQTVADCVFHARTLVQDVSMRRGLAALKTLPVDPGADDWFSDPGSTAQFLRTSSAFADRNRPEIHSCRNDFDRPPSSNVVRGDSIAEYLPAIWSDSRIVAERCRQLAGQCHLDREAVETCRLAGLLHKAGQLALSVFVEEYGEIRDTAEQIGQPLEYVEQQVLGVDHMRVGAFLAELWGLPRELTEAIENHLEPRRAAAGCELSPVAVVHAALASLAADRADWSYLRDVGLDRICQLHADNTAEANFAGSPVF